MKIRGVFLCLLTLPLFVLDAHSQTTVRERPVEWNNLVFGGRFMDLFLSMPDIGKLTNDTWGDDNVKPRDIKNGIENSKYSFWGGNKVLGDDDKYHFFVCGWLESSPRGHATWPNSIVFHAISDNLYGPFVVKDTIGKGHNPEVYRLKDGRYVLYVIDGYYLSEGVNGPWTYNKFEFLNRNRPIIDGLSNLTFAQREDGSYLMVNRGGGIWFSQTGLSPYNQVTDERVYPPVKGEFEDPVVWRDNVQYHLIVNDWLGRTAFYLRSKDGVKWVVDPGEAYLPGISKREDGSIEKWFKYERLKVFQDGYGRAIQANFAVIDVEKKYDQSRDNHSSKNISIPLTIPRLLTILDKDQITAKTKIIRVKITSEPGFNPLTDINLNSLKFGSSGEVNFGRGCKVINTERSGSDLIVSFDSQGNGITDDEFVAKMIGKTSDGKLIFGYARLPWVNYIEPILSARLPEIAPDSNGFNIKVEVQNFGQIASKAARLKIVYVKDEKEVEVGTGKIPKLNAYQKTTVELACGSIFDKGVEYKIIVILNPDDKAPAKLHAKITPVKLSFHEWALTPPMGWNSWDCYGPTVVEDEVKANADYMAVHLKKFGWEFIVVDIRWYVANDKSGGYNEKDPEYNMDNYGRLLPATNRFPSSANGKGFKPLGDYIHSKGLKFGIHMMRGIPVLAVKQNTPILGTNSKAKDIYSPEGQCFWLKDMYTIVAGKPGAQEYYNSLFQLYSSWGLDFVKVDDLSGHTAEIEMVRKAIDNCGRAIVISISPGGDKPETAEFLKNNVNMWRTSNDFWDNWPALKNQFPILKSWAGFGGKGNFPDGDMLPLGKIGLRAERGEPRMTGFTKDEQYTLMSLFAIFRSPLMFGGDLPGNDEFTLSLITNKDVLNVNQNSINGKQLFSENDLIAWTADDPKTGDKYLALFNASDQQPVVESKAIPQEQPLIIVKFDQLGLTGTHSVTDLWSGENLGQFTGTFTRTINRHGAGLYRIH